MINKLLKYVILILFFYINCLSFSNSSTKTEIIYKINDEILTNIDIENEKKFLIFLNPDLKKISSDQINSISKNSLINRTIKKIELRKYFKLDTIEISDIYINNYIKNSIHINKENLIENLNKINLNFDYFEENFLIDNLWREFIFNKFKSQVKIDEIKLREEIKNMKTEVEELDLSEILFKIDSNINYQDLVDKIYLEINSSSFEVAASLFSISESKDYGGRLGWVKSSQISQNILSEINNGKNITVPIETNNGYLIIKINERRKVKEELNLEQALSAYYENYKPKEIKDKAERKYREKIAFSIIIIILLILSLILYNK